MTEKVDLLKFEKEQLALGKNLIAGVDEVGRGALAGPLVVASVIMPLEENFIIEGVNDSKKLSPKKREMLYSQIIERAYSYKIAVVDHEVVDDVNILNATKMGMKNVIDNLKYCDVALVDAVKLLDVKYPTISITHGDALSYSIACASIIAKVYRDKMMVELGNDYPQYFFHQNKGYGTAKHIQAIKQVGASIIHRKTFLTKILGENL